MKGPLRNVTASENIRMTSPFVIDVKSLFFFEPLDIVSVDLECEAV